MVIVSACGGGGGGASSKNNQPQPSPVLASAEESTSNPESNTETADSGNPEAPAVETPAESPQQPVIVSEPSENVTEQALLDAAITTAEELSQQCTNRLSTVFPDGLIEATMPYLSNYVYSTRQNNIPLHVAGDSGAVYSWLGEHSAGSRYVYFGAGIFTQSESHYWGDLGNELAQNTREVLDWITRTDSASTATPLIAYALSSRAKSQFEVWLSTQGLEHQWTLTTDPSVLSSGNYDLLLGLVGTDLPELESALASGKAILLWSEVFNPGVGIHQLGLNWNWWGSDTVGNLVSVEEQCQQAYFSGDILTTLKSLRDETLDFDYSGDACSISLYTKTCSPIAVIRNDDLSLQDAFLSGVEELQQQIAHVDAEGRSLFDPSNDETLIKLAVRLGDQYREDIVYPMDHLTTKGSQFYKALFADYTNHYARDNSPAQTQAGDFGDKLVELSQQPAESGTIVLRPTQFSEWNSTGFTARPGKPVTLTRTDSNPSTVSVRINMLRHQATKIWNTDGYKRPLYTSSHTITLPSNSSIVLSSPIGGPIYVHWDANTNDESSPDITLQIDGALPHPFLDQFNDSHIQAFTDMLKKNEFDWVDIKTPAVEVHSRALMLTDALNSVDGDTGNGYTQPDVRLWVGNLNTYLIGSALSLAGYVDDSVVPMNDNLTQFCNHTNLNCADSVLHRKPSLQHINTDHRASCGDLCSGNPFDSNSPLNPLGYGESHEMGHNLQRHRLNFHGARSIEASNNIFPLYSAWRWLEDNSLNRHPSIRLPDPAKAFSQLQQSVSFKSEPGIGHPIWSESQIYVNADVRFMLYMQLMFIHHQWEKYNAEAATGWDSFTKLYKLERQFDQAVSDDQQWLSERDRLGFSNYDRSAALSMQGNDFMAIALSFISNRDHTDYLQIWGIDISELAKTQIQTNGTVSAVPLTFWRTPDDRYLRWDIPSDDPANAIPLDGTTQW